jgi:predicted nucleotidyltransferase
MGVGDVLRRALRPEEERIAVAFLFGSFARGEQRESSDVDVMVVTKEDGLTVDDVAGLLSKAQEELGREVNPFVLGAGEFREKWRSRNHFVRRVVEGEKAFLIGDADELKRLAEERVAESAQDKRRGNRRPVGPGKSRPQRRKGQGAQR